MAGKNEKKLTNLAKLSKSKTTEVVKETQEEPKQVLTPEEERDLKAKEKVATLLEGVDLTLKKTGDDLLEVESEVEVVKGTEWLEEQVQILSEENERLKSEAQLFKSDYDKLFSTYQQLKSNPAVQQASADPETKLMVRQLFNELQQQHMALGANFFIHPPSFMLRMVKFFPFFEQDKRF